MENYYQKILGEYFLAAPCRNVLLVFIAHVDLLGVYRDAAITRIWDLLISRRMRLLTCCFQTAEDYQRVYGQRTSATSRSKFHGYAYDAVWTIALAVDSVIADRRGRYLLTTGDRSARSYLRHRNRNRNQHVARRRDANVGRQIAVGTDILRPCPNVWYRH